MLCFFSFGYHWYYNKKKKKQFVTERHEGKEVLLRGSMKLYI